jgi:hypothetical protein
MDPWLLEGKLAALQCGAHQSANHHVDFLCGELIDIIHKGQWVLLPAHLTLSDPNLSLNPFGVMPQLGCRPRTICDYSLFCVSDDTVDTSPYESMPFGMAILCILQAITCSDPHLGPVFLANTDILTPSSITSLSVLQTFPSWELSSS